MKKIILILSLFLSCYIIYNMTNKNNIYYLSLGDGLATSTYNNDKAGYGYAERLKDYLKEENKLEEYNFLFTNNDYRITDLLNMIKYNDYKYLKGKEIYINQALKQADIITLSIGMNELYYKILINDNNIYTYINEMLSDMEALLKYINKYNHKKVLVLGYYNITNNNQDIFNYVNYKLKKIVEIENFEYIELDNLFNKNDNYFENKTNFYPNYVGYEEIYKILLAKVENN